MSQPDPVQVMADLRAILKPRGKAPVVNMHDGVNDGGRFYPLDMITAAIDAMEQRLKMVPVLGEPDPLEKLAMLFLLRAAGLA